MFSYSTSFDIHEFICGDIFQPSPRFWSPTQFLQQTNKHMSKQTNKQTQTQTQTNKHVWEQNRSRFNSKVKFNAAFGDDDNHDVKDENYFLKIEIKK